MIRLENINKVYRTKAGVLPALTDVNLHIESGEIYGVIGKSGAGKSTLIRCVNLLERPTSGKVIVDGKDLTQLTERDLRHMRHSMGMIFQHFNLLSSRTVYDNIALPLELIGKSKQEIRDRVLPLIKMVELDGREKSYPNQLSGGQKQRVAIARALATNPKVLLCDEMTSALDPDTTRAILKLIKKINEALELTIMLITHEMDVIKTLADHVALLDDGKVIEQTDAVSLFKNPQTDIAKSFVQSTFKLELPQKIQKKISETPIDGGNVLIRIAFVGHATEEPVIDGLVRHHNVRVNILQGNIEYLRHEMVGMLVVSLRGSDKEIASAKNYLHEQGLEIEEIGYVADDDWSDN